MMKCKQINYWILLGPFSSTSGLMLVEPLEGMIGFANIVLIALQFENVDVDHAVATNTSD